MEDGFLPGTLTERGTGVGRLERPGCVYTEEGRYVTSGRDE